MTRATALLPGGRVYLPNGKSWFQSNRKVYYNGMFYSVWVQPFAGIHRTTYAYRLEDTSLDPWPGVFWHSQRNRPII